MVLTSSWIAGLSSVWPHRPFFLNWQVNQFAEGQLSFPCFPVVAQRPFSIAWPHAHLLCSAGPVKQRPALLRSTRPRDNWFVRRRNDRLCRRGANRLSGFCQSEHFRAFIIP